jgi:hypothetical protein
VKNILAGSLEFKVSMVVGKPYFTKSSPDEENEVLLMYSYAFISLLDVAVLLMLLPNTKSSILLGSTGM